MGLKNAKTAQGSIERLRKENVSMQGLVERAAKRFHSDRELGGKCIRQMYILKKDDEEYRAATSRCHECWRTSH